LENNKKELSLNLLHEQITEVGEKNVSEYMHRTSQFSAKISNMFGRVIWCTWKQVAMKFSNIIVTF